MSKGKKRKGASKKKFKAIEAMMLPKPKPLSFSRSIEPVGGMDEDTAYDGFSNLASRRELTARERDVLVRVLQSLVRPHYTKYWDDPFNKKARKALAKYSNLDIDADVMQIIANVLNPRDE